MREREDLMQFIRVKRVVDAGFPIFRAPWGLRTPEGVCVLAWISGAPCIVNSPPSNAPLALESGSLLLTFRHQSLLIGDDPRRDFRPYSEFTDESKTWPPLQRRSFGGEGRVTKIAAVRFELEALPPSLAQTIPDVIVLDRATIRSDRSLLLGLATFAAEISSWRPAQPSIVARQIEVILGQGIRAQAEASGDDRGSMFFRALGDRHIAKAISLIEERGAAVWTVATLARAVGLTHTTFTRHFQRQTGENPNNYLARRRIVLAMKLLQDTDLSVWDISEETGYSSMASFSRAFKNVVGTSPASFRRSSSGNARRMEHALPPSRD